MNASFFVQPPEGHAALLKFSRSEDSATMYVYAFSDREMQAPLYQYSFSSDTQFPAFFFSGDPIVVSWLRLSVADEVRVYYGKLEPGEPASADMRVVYDTPSELSVTSTAHTVSALVEAEATKEYPPLCGMTLSLDGTDYGFSADKAATGSGAIRHVNGAGCSFIGTYALCGNTSVQHFCVTSYFNTPQVACALLWGPFAPEDLPASEAELSAEIMVATQLP